MMKMMQFDPQKRPTAKQLLQHEYFNDYVPPSISSPNPYGSGSKFHNPNEGSKSRARVDSRKQKIGSSNINKNSFYRSR